MERTAVYGIDGRLDASFPKNTLSILTELAPLAAELNSSDFKLDNQSPVSRVSATLNLCYHQVYCATSLLSVLITDWVLQCIVLATRPLLMCLLRDKLEMGRTGNDSRCEIVEPIKALLRTCYDSAHKSLRILTKLQSQDLLGMMPRRSIKGSHFFSWRYQELFLPFDLDHAFSAGFILALISAIQPFPDVIGDSYFETITHLLDALIAGGNLPACFRRQELERLHDMLHLIDQHGDVPQLEGQDNNNIPVSEEQGISPNQLLNVASMLDGHQHLNVDLGDVSSWLWEATDFEGLPPLWTTRNNMGYADYIIPTKRLIIWDKMHYVLENYKA